MRVDVKKFLFVGFRGALQAFFEKAQEAGLVHFIDPRRLKAKEVPQKIQDIVNAIKVVRELPTLKQEEPEKFSEVNVIAEKILSMKHDIERLEEEKRTLKLEISRVDVFGDFSLEDIQHIEKETGRTLQFYFGKKGTVEEELPDEVIYIASKHGLDYFMAVNKELKHYEQLVEMKIDQELHVLRSRLEEVQNDIVRLEASLKKYNKYNEFLHYALTVKYNAHELDKAASYVEEPIEGQLFSVEGWVPVNRVEELKHDLADTEVHLAEISLNEGEEPPTYLENKGYSRIGEDLVHIYDTPSNTDKDPSLWVLVSFAVFFAMIINDGGYGLLFLAGALYYRFKNGQLKKAGMRVWKLLVVLFGSCVVWGLLTNSFFGVSIGPDNPLRKVSALHWLVEKKAEYHLKQKDEVYKDWVKKFPGIANAEDPQAFLLGAKKESNGKTAYEMIDKFSDGILMELALLVGIIHVCISFIRYLGRNWAGLGWVIAIIGSYLYLPLFLGATSLATYGFGLNREEIAQGGLYMIYGGIAIAVILGIVKDKWLGLLEVTNVIQIFADVLSYLRLYALGLAGAIIGQTVNDIAGSLMYLPALILIGIGHGLNMVLAVVGGVIHGLRLNFIEWYHYSFEGGGKLFTPLKKLETD
ncbi:V-type ATP synthase subunit I [Waddlia chondrophila 2032/99]|uniref:V-type ATP synthase, subunit I n=2 Tax=Waddlia chondrophila TaxID=71667 RepID=D6YV15_WADCW|nr:V-type ATP synthase subunit I [Waddlia chondrophila]ADI37976.1 V-type ATP synthase, subunit I [Waddlia chondrophila WSU 86-1044]CCB91883.1 V-type ATP synthase subunit I [Waddlia chondrophila 2032/99]